MQDLNGEKEKNLGKAEKWRIIEAKKIKGSDK
jgi:hypothetical protein